VEGMGKSVMPTVIGDAGCVGVGRGWQQEAPAHEEEQCFWSEFHRISGSWFGGEKAEVGNEQAEKPRSCPPAGGSSGWSWWTGQSRMRRMNVEFVSQAAKSHLPMQLRAVRSAIAAAGGFRGLPYSSQVDVVKGFRFPTHESRARLNAWSLGVRLTAASGCIPEGRCPVVLANRTSPTGWTYLPGPSDSAYPGPRPASRRSRWPVWTRKCPSGLPRGVVAR